MLGLQKVVARITKKIRFCLIFGGWMGKYLAVLLTVYCNRCWLNMVENPNHIGLSRSCEKQSLYTCFNMVSIMTKVVISNFSVVECMFLTCIYFSVSYVMKPV